MAEQLLLLMGTRDFTYMAWAAERASWALKHRIHLMMAEIADGRRVYSVPWPSVHECLARLGDSDPVVGIMSAQVLRIHQLCGTLLGTSVARRVADLVSEATRRPWYTR